MVRIGIAGIGFMGMIHYQAVKRIPGARVTAIATRDARKRAGDWSMIQGNFGPRGQQEDLSGVALFETAEEMVNSDDVDLVDICLPSDDHVTTALAALHAGKHVLVEKPIALQLNEAERMVLAAREAERLLMVAHVLPFFADFQFAHEAIQSGRYGRCLAGNFRRHISPPSWSDSVTDLAKMGGPLIDLHIHDNHFIVVAFGKPKQVFSSGTTRDGVVTYVSTEYLYSDDGPRISATSGALSQPSRSFTHGYELYFERATIHYEAGQPLTVYTPTGIETPELSGGDDIEAFRAEILAAVESVRSLQSSSLLDGQWARDALELCHAEAESIRTGCVIPFNV